MLPRIGLTCHTDDQGSGSARVRDTVNRGYIEWIERAGGLPVLLPNVSPELAELLLAGLDGLLLTGGADIAPRLYGAEPAPGLGPVDVPRDRFELPLATAALATELPLLGICRGIQTLNVAAGGTLRQDLLGDPTVTVQHRMQTSGGTAVHHTVTLEPGSRLAAILGAGSLAVNSYHHQAVDRLGAGLVAVARTADGVIEAIERPGERFILAVQWHPEVMAPATAASAALFAAFIAAARATG